MKELKGIRWIVCAGVLFVFSLLDCYAAGAKTTLKALDAAPRPFGADHPG